MPARAGPAGSTVESVRSIDPADLMTEQPGRTPASAVPGPRVSIGFGMSPV
ncbi:hypothetical protein ACH34R_00145 [Spongiactinospora sp. 9N601]